MSLSWQADGAGVPVPAGSSSTGPGHVSTPLTALIAVLADALGHPGTARPRSCPSHPRSATS